MNSKARSMSESSALSSLILPRWKWVAIGSLPHTSTTSALDFLASFDSILPFAPELPNVSAREGMLQRGERSLGLHWQGLEEEEYSALSRLVTRQRRVGERLSLFKVQLIGPCALHRYAKNASLERSCAAVLRQARYLFDVSAQCASHIVLQFDEPALPLDDWGGEASAVLCEILHRVKRWGAFTALHCCAREPYPFLRLPVDLLALPHWQCDSLSEDRAATLMDPIFVHGMFESTGGPREIASGRERWRRFARENSTSFLASATCGHAGATIDYLHDLYRQSA